ncbi:MAG: hypothetical protein ACI9J3_003262 [Parvicellaceae bacterium]
MFIRITYLFFSLVLFSSLGICQAKSDTLIVDGIYRGKNLKIDNRSKKGNCTQRILVNGKLAFHNKESKGFEIQLKNMGFSYADSIHVYLIHKAGTPPKVLNLEKILLEEVDADNFKVDEKGVLEFRAMGEVAPLHYIVEGYRWGHWVKMDTLSGVGNTDEQKYKTTIALNEGENLFRIVRPNFSLRSAIITDTLKVKFDGIIKQNVLTKRKSIIFARSTFFEVYDAYGVKIQTGIGSEIDCSHMDTGEYYLNFDNIKTSFFCAKGKPIIET